MFPFFTSRRRDKPVEEAATITLKTVHELPIISSEVYATLAACVYNDISFVHTRENHSPGYLPSSSSSISRAHNTQHVVLATVKTGSKCEGESVKIALPHGWQLFLTSKQFHLNREGYFAAAFVNQSLQHCIVAQRGTCDVFGLRAGLWMYFDELTIQLFLAEQFSTELRKSLSLSVYSHYTISYTGHSLGALIATIRALQENVYAVTFEPPGCKPLVSRLLGEEAVRAALGKIVSYLNQPNPINTLKAHCGLLIALPIVSQELPSGTLMLQLKNKRNVQESVDSLLARKRTNSLSEKEECKHTTATLSNNSNNISTSTSTNCNESNVKETKQNACPEIQSGSKTPSLEKGVSSTSSLPLSTAVKSNKFSSLSSPRLREMFTYPTWYKPLSLRDYAFSQTRGYLFSSVGIPELQQYLSKIEPVIREMLEQTQQEHSIHNFVRYFAEKQERINSNKNRTTAHSAIESRLLLDRSENQQLCVGDNVSSNSNNNEVYTIANSKEIINNNLSLTRSNDKSEAIILSWPSSVLQFVEYYNTIRALDDPANEPHTVHAAYVSMLNSLFKTTPLDEYQLPRCYLDDRSYYLWKCYTIYQQMLKCDNKTDETVKKVMSSSANVIPCVSECTSDLNGYDALYKKLHSAFSTLSKLEEKMLSVIHIDNTILSIIDKNGLSALQAKEFLSMLCSRKTFAQLMKPSQSNSTSAKL